MSSIDIEAGCIAPGGARSHRSSAWQTHDRFLGGSRASCFQLLFAGTTAGHYRLRMLLSKSAPREKPESRLLPPTCRAEVRRRTFHRRRRSSVSVRPSPQAAEPRLCRQSGCDGVARGFPVPRQQFGDAASWVIGQSCEHVGKPSLGINIIQLAGLDQGKRRQRGALRRPNPRRSSFSGPRQRSGLRAPQHCLISRFGRHRGRG